MKNEQGELVLFWPFSFIRSLWWVRKSTYSNMQIKWHGSRFWSKTPIFNRHIATLKVLSNLFYVSYAINLVRPGILNSELELPLRLWVLHSIGGIICSRAGSSSSRAGSSSSRANNSGLYQDPRVQVPEFRQVCSLNESLVPTYKKKSSIFWYTFISHSGNRTRASRVKARCTCHNTI